MGHQFSRNRLEHNENLEFKYLVKKIGMLFMIFGASRKRGISSIYADNIFFKDDKAVLP